MEEAYPDSQQLTQSLIHARAEWGDVIVAALVLLITGVSGWGPAKLHYGKSKWRRFKWRGGGALHQLGSLREARELGPDEQALHP